MSKLCELNFENFLVFSWASGSILPAAEAFFLPHTLSVTISNSSRLLLLPSIARSHRTAVQEAE